MWWLLVNRWLMVVPHSLSILNSIKIQPWSLVHLSYLTCYSAEKHVLPENHTLGTRGCRGTLLALRRSSSSPSDTQNRPTTRSTGLTSSPSSGQQLYSRAGMSVLNNTVNSNLFDKSLIPECSTAWGILQPYAFTKQKKNKKCNPTIQLKAMLATKHKVYFIHHHHKKNKYIHKITVVKTSNFFNTIAGGQMFN